MKVFVQYIVCQVDSFVLLAVITGNRNGTDRYLTPPCENKNTRSSGVHGCGLFPVWLASDITTYPFKSAGTPQRFRHDRFLCCDSRQPNALSAGGVCVTRRPARFLSCSIFSAQFRSQQRGTFNLKCTVSRNIMQTFCKSDRSLINCFCN